MTSYKKYFENIRQLQNGFKNNQIHLYRLFSKIGSIKKDCLKFEHFHPALIKTKWWNKMKKKVVVFVFEKGKYVMDNIEC